MESGPDTESENESEHESEHIVDGAVAPESEGGFSDQLVTQDLLVERLPERLCPDGEFPETAYHAVHAVRVTSEETVVTIETRSYREAPSVLLLKLGEELIRAAIAKVRADGVTVASP